MSAIPEFLVNSRLRRSHSVHYSCRQTSSRTRGLII